MPKPKVLPAGIHYSMTARCAIGLLLICAFVLNGKSAPASSDLVLHKHDKILVLAPHPDDETIGTGGIIQRATELGIPLKVVYLTSGETNELAFLAYKKHPVLDRRGLLKMGETRHQEALNAMQFFGLKKSQLIFFGYPDFGTMAIFTKHWHQSRSYKSMLARVNAVPYQNAFSYNAPYKGESVLHDLEQILYNFQPTKIFVTLPADTNLDHRAYYLFLQVALWDLKRKLPNTEVFPYIIHVIRWPLPRGFHPELPLNVPKTLTDAGLTWWTFPLTPNEIKNKEKAVEYYKSQKAYNPKYLPTFARKNELFGRFSDIQLPKNEKSIPWEKYVSEQNIISHLAEEGRPGHNIIRTLAYARQDGYLYIHLAINRWESKVSGINLYLMGYKSGADFATMPKIRININFDRFVSVFDGSSRIFVEDVRLIRKRGALLLKIPLSTLGAPDKILSCMKTYIADWPLEATPWRTLIIKQSTNVR